MAQEFKYLFTPLDVGPMKLRNRIVSTPHATCFPMTNDQEAYYQAEKAKGGVSLCCTGATLVDPEEVATDSKISFASKLLEICNQQTANSEKFLEQNYTQVQDINAR